ncbi:DUF4037 domain-containing protein [Agarivorans sp. MS3-6]
MTESAHFFALVEQFSQLPQVEAILLAGSRATGLADEHSDYDVYIYLNAPLDVSTRQGICDQYCQYMELNNQFWETEDDGVLLDGIDIELIYRDLAFLETELQAVVEQHQAKVGYSTCFWANLLSSKVLYDAKGRAKQLQQRFSVVYPSPLQQAVIDKNFPLLISQIPAYYYQLEKALKRQDRVSVNHRCAEFLASYFDILFAVNAVPHPGEKRMLQYAESQCAIRPANLVKNVNLLLSQIGQAQSSLLDTLKELVEGLQQCIQQETGFTLPGN